MPLIKSSSREALSHNIAAERAAGKPEAQSVAIGLSVQRRARGKRRAPSLADVQKRRRAKAEE
jgi:hypothetical protein